MPTNSDFRILALKHAVESREQTTDTEAIVKRAEAFYTFLAMDNA